MDDELRRAHCHALFGAISVTLSALGCAPAVQQPTDTVIVGPPAVSASAVASTPSEVMPDAALSPIASATPTPVPSATPTPEPSASVATATNKPRKPPPKRPPVKPPHSTIVEGRPFIVDDAARLAAVGSHTGWADEIDLRMHDVTLDERVALIRHYTDWALAEHASIASFTRFALQLIALGAPSHLVTRATDAMADETRHARFGFGLVKALSNEQVGPGAMSIDRAFTDETTMESVLRLVAREGMIGETLAALEVRAAADLAELPFLRVALAKIADEESRHAELAYAFAAWALEQSPTLAHVIEEELRAWDAPALPIASGLTRWGILDESTRRAVRDAGFANVVSPLATQLLAPMRRAAPSPTRQGQILERT